MNYAVLEIMTTDGTTSCSTPEGFSDEDYALAEFHTLAAAAAVSNESVDTVVLIREDGFVIKRECFKHPESEDL